MPHIFQRYPRFILLLTVLLVGSFLYLQGPDLTRLHPASYTGLPSDPNLPSRIQRAEYAYQQVLEKRQDLIKKYGPTPTEVAMFPPDRDPWPAYTVWDFFPPAFHCPHELERIGDLGDGGKWTCGLSRLTEKPDCVIYSFGIDWESSWEASALENTNHCVIWGYDHQINSFGRQVTHESFLKRFRTHFTSHVQLGSTDKHGEGDEPKLYTLRNIMNTNGHSFIDILRIDIEGYEFDTLKEIVKPYVESGEPLPFGQLQVEIHLWNKKFHDFLSWWEMLESAGLRPVMMEPNLVYINYNRNNGAELAEYTFINIKGNNIFVSDPEQPIVGAVGILPDDQ